MNRREFLQHTVAGGAVTALGASMSPIIDRPSGQVANRLLQPPLDHVEL